MRIKNNEIIANNVEWLNATAPYNKYGYIDVWLVIELIHAMHSCHQPDAEHTMRFHALRVCLFTVQLHKC